MSSLPDIRSAKDLQYGLDPYLDAWLLHFMTENNLEYRLNPLHNASPEQLRFMAHLEEDEIFVPCSDEMFGLLLKKRLTKDLLIAYNKSWKVMIRLVRENIADRKTRQRIIGFCRHRFRLALTSNILIPSRLMKRLASIFLTQSGVEDPYRARKVHDNRRAKEFIKRPVMDRLVNACPDRQIGCLRLADLRLELDLLELKRLLYLSAWDEIWRGDGRLSEEELAGELEKTCPGFESLREVFGMDPFRTKKILYLPESSGGIIFDLMIIKLLLRQGHQVILALKKGFYFQAPTIWDLEEDPVLAETLAGAHVIREDRMGKNDLLRVLREHKFAVISDGTYERLNLYRVSVTFARAWKEADLIIAKGEPHYRRLIMTGQNFTRDILCFLRDKQGRFQLHFRPKPEAVRKFTEGDLEDMAGRIIASMRRAKQKGKSVMFYSAIIGSIPGQTKTAIKVLTTFVTHLRSILAGTFVINPAEHFEQGMDGDDLMFMWEKVQRSGMIDVWRFQSVDDIEQSFSLMDKKVPPAWAGKDATYSTGCTKEMVIALDMQKRQPELQILGPGPEKFFRRREYGVGKYFDAGIEYQ